MMNKRSAVCLVRFGGLVMVAACSGELGESELSGSEAPGPGVMGVTGAGGTGAGPMVMVTPPPPPASCSEGSASIVRSPMRRHDVAEYNNTVADLLNDDGRPADAFLPDTRFDGFSNNEAVQKISPIMAQQYLTAGERLSARAVAKLPALIGCDPAATGEETCAKKFIAQFGKRAYRRPLTTGEQSILFKVYTTSRTAGDFTIGIKAVLQAMLAAPQFLYRLELSAPPAGQTSVALDPWEVASRLSYLLWGTMPDPALFAAAEAGTLVRREDILAQTTRMLASGRAKTPIATFFAQWLLLEDFDKHDKDPAVFKTWADNGVLVKQEMEQFLERVWPANAKPRPRRSPQPRSA